MIFRDAKIEDKEFILAAHKEINIVSGLNDSTFEQTIDKDVFEDKKCKAIIAENNGEVVGMVLYSNIYWANCGNGIYLSQAYVKKEYRGEGIYKDLLKQIEEKEKDCNFITDLVGTENEIMKQTLNHLNFEKSDLITYYRKIK